MRLNESARGLKILIKREYKNGNYIKAKNYYNLYKAKGGKMSYIVITRYKKVYRRL